MGKVCWVVLILSLEDILPIYRDTKHFLNGRLCYSFSCDQSKNSAARACNVQDVD